MDEKEAGNDSAHESSAVSRRSVEQQEDSRTCSICYCPFENGEDIRALPCMHRYHKACVDDWFYQRIKTVLYLLFPHCLQFLLVFI